MRENNFGLKKVMKLFKCDGFTTFKFATLLNWRTIRRGLKTRRRRVIKAANEAMIPTAAKGQWQTSYEISDCGKTVNANRRISLSVILLLSTLFKMYTGFKNFLLFAEQITKCL